MTERTPVRFSNMVLYKAGDLLALARAKWSSDLALGCRSEQHDRKRFSAIFGDRIVAIARQEGIVRGRTMRVDTTIVGSNNYYPTDSILSEDGARMLTPAKKKTGSIAAEAGAKLHDRSRSVKFECSKLLGRRARKFHKGDRNSTRLMANCCRGQAKRVSRSLQGSCPGREALGRHPATGRAQWRAERDRHKAATIAASNPTNQDSDSIPIFAGEKRAEGKRHTRR